MDRATYPVVRGPRFFSSSFLSFFSSGRSSLPTPLRLCRTLGITNPEGLMIKDREEGGDAYLFQDANGIYMWSMPTNEVYKYTKPTSRDDILAEMRKPAGRGKVEMTLMPRRS